MFIPAKDIWFDEFEYDADCLCGDELETFYKDAIRCTEMNLWGGNINVSFNQSHDVTQPDDAISWQTTEMGANVSVSIADLVRDACRDEYANPDDLKRTARVFEAFARVIRAHLKLRAA